MQQKQLTVEHLRAIKGGEGAELIGDVSTTIKIEVEGTVGPFTIKAESETTF